MHTLPTLVHCLPQRDVIACQDSKEVGSDNGLLSLRRLFWRSLVAPPKVSRTCGITRRLGRFFARGTLPGVQRVGGETYCDWEKSTLPETFFAAASHNNLLFFAGNTSSTVCCVPNRMIDRFAFDKLFLLRSMLMMGEVPAQKQRIISFKWLLLTGPASFFFFFWEMPRWFVTRMKRQGVTP